jgi:hypothetical protein
MQGTREILNTFIPMIKENLDLDKNGMEIIKEIENLMDRADFRRKYYRLQLWTLINDLGNSNSELKEILDGLLNDLAIKWEGTLTKALDEGKLNP